MSRMRKVTNMGGHLKMKMARKVSGDYFLDVMGMRSLNDND